MTTNESVRLDVPAGSGQRTLRPGIIIALKTRVASGVTYSKVSILNTPETARWETTRVIPDPEGYEQARRVRNRAANLVRGACAKTSFGLLCPYSAESALDAKLYEARGLVDKHNEQSAAIKVEFFVLKGRIATNDMEASRAVASEVAEMLDAMERGIGAGDVKSVREAASKARQMQAMLEGDAAEKVGVALEAARKAAREIVRRIEKKGEAAEVVIGEIDRSPIQMARISLLELSQDHATAVEGGPAIDAQRFADVATEMADVEVPATPTTAVSLDDLGIADVEVPAATTMPTIDFDDAPAL